MDITEFRKQNPVYDDMSDGELVYGLYKKNYTDMPMGEYADKLLLLKNLELRLQLQAQQKVVLATMLLQALINKISLS